MSGFKLYFKYIKMTIMSQMAYKASFIMMSVGHFMITFIEFIGIYALFARFDQIKGWALYEVAIFYGVVNCAFAISESIGRGYDTFHVHIRMGSFDRILLRPRSLPLQILGSEFQLMRIGRFAQGLMVLIYGILNLDRTLSLQDVTLLVFSILGGVFVFLGLLVLQATLSIFTVQSIEVMNVFTYGGVQMAQYPMSIYKTWFRRFFTFVIPLGAMSYVPVSAILRGGNLLGAYMTPFVGLAFFAVSLGVFNFGTRYYCSTGS